MTDFPEFDVPEPKQPIFFMKAADHLDFLHDENGVRVWFGDPSALFAEADWFEMRAAMARHVAEGYSGGAIVVGGMEGLWQAVPREVDYEGIMVSVNYPGGISSFRLKSPITMLLPLTAAETIKYPAPGIITDPFCGRVYINHENRNWDGSIDISWK